MDMPGKVVLCVLVSLSFAGCYPDPIELGVSFPTQQSFFYSDHAVLYMFDITAEERGTVCPTIIPGLLNDTLYREPTTKSGAVPVCDLRSGGFQFEDIGDGLRAFAVLVHGIDERATPILYGCTTADTYVDAPDITIDLMTTEGAQEIIDTVPSPDYEDVEDKCSKKTE